ncbi:MAG: DedA family protein [Sphingomonadaceae bacterium]|nr:DedA family protein [Sphingomonadaceae bacterium]
MSDWIGNLIEQSSYLGVALLMLLETVFPPIPSEVIMAYAGLKASEGSMTLWGAIAAGTAGAMAGNIFWYWVARVIGVERIMPLADRYGRWLTVDAKELRLADDFFDRYDRWFVLFGRMVPTIRSLVSIPAGLFGMRWRTFLLFSTIGTAGWTAGLAIAGYALGRQFEDVERYLGPISMAVIGLLVLIYLWRVITWKPRA